MADVIEENDLSGYIRYRHKVTAAAWSSKENLWTLRVTRTDTGEEVRFTAGFLWMCQGYYHHGEGYLPDWPGMERFGGRLVHTEAWPDDLDYHGKKVIVVGSGATAATLIPAMADDCGHITMLQRSPTYFRTGRNAIEIADELRELGVRDDWIHDIVRRKIQHEQAKFARRTFTEPEVVIEELLTQARAFLGPDYDIKTHFTPHYRPWQQRLAFIPDGDLFRAIRDGRASVVTDEIDTFTETGIQLKSGGHLDADIIVAATGFHLNVLGDIAFTIDGEPLRFSETVTYRGMMFTGVPNMVWVFGYFRASWTLRVDIVSDFVCRLLQHMREVGARKITVALRPEDEGMPVLPWTDPGNFNPGYLTRGLHLLPRRGDKPEWQHSQDHWADAKTFPTIDLRDPAFVYV
jgi:cation diffusion facilitator CzcD-associated flavoprotein CzcO